MSEDNRSDQPVRGDQPRSDQRPQGDQRGPQQSRGIADLTKLLGFDPTKPTRLSEELMAEVIKDLRKGKIEEAKKKATELYTKAMALAEDKSKKDREYAKAGKAFDKELGKVIQQIKGVLEGAADIPEDADDKSDKSE